MHWQRMTRLDPRSLNETLGIQGSAAAGLAIVEAGKLAQSVGDVPEEPWWFEEKREARLYIGSDDPTEIRMAYRAFIRTLSDLGADHYLVEEAWRGSLFTKLSTWGKSFVGKREVRKRAHQALLALEQATVDGKIAANNLANAQAVAALVEAGAKIGSLSYDAETLQVAVFTDEHGKIHARSRVPSSGQVADNRVADEKMLEPKEMFEAISGPDSETA